MPLYEYRCRDCGERFEILQSIGADATGVRCPSCGAERAERQLSTFAASSSTSTSTAGFADGTSCRSGFT